ncbi:MAG: hypothetical protein ACRDP8_14470, partial [Actinopolymorphaceae bacterium]
MTSRVWDHNEVTRRILLRTSGAAFLVTASATSCSFLSTDPGSDGNGDNGGGAAKKGKEAPMLAALVKDGKLPPVAERLPDEPLVVEPNERIGVYGGQWNSGTLGPSDGAWLGRTVGYETFMRWDPQFQKVIPNVAKDITVEDGG